TDQRTERANEILLAANRVRRAVIEPLEELRIAMRASKKVPDLCHAVYDYLCRLDIRAQLSAQAKKELSLGQHREASETLRLYHFTVETLTELAELLPDSEMTAEEFLSVLTLYFSVADLGSVPSVHDCVVIGSANLLRVEHVKASFLLGLCEGEFPKAVTDTGLLTESDKQALEALGIILDSGQKLRSAEELFYAYRAMTKPTEKLYLSYPAMHPDGSQRTPSLAFTRMEFLFDRKPKQVRSEQLAKTNTENTAKNEREYRLPDMGENVRLHLSQSSIRAFVLCPYQYYSTYRLKLRSKKDSTVSAADEGNFLHFVFEGFLKRSICENGSLELPSFERLPAVADEIIEEYLARVCPIPLTEMDSRLLHLFERLRGLAILILREIVGELLCGKFKPIGFEQRLGGSEENALPAVRLNLRDGGTVELHGTVDRVDVFEQDGRLFVRIVDYKTGEHKFSFDKVRTGEDLQLVLYLFAVVASNPERFVPCGAEFLYSAKDGGKTSVSRSGFLLDNDNIRQAADGTDSQIYLKNLLKSSGEELSSVIEEMQETIRSVAERILSGEARKTPSEDACKFCAIKDHCDIAYREKK
ncbi:MAG: PD-(D/E)XK nuclease family protein, partial [Clostridia bacterium]|nr:PD-(D/E)XK nuclease family protein [Clostridia bacterium]